MNDNKDRHEKFNFEAADLTFDEHRFPSCRYCLGFVETKSLGEKSNQLHIEKLKGASFAVKKKRLMTFL